MCCCASPNVNGEFGYRWQPSEPSRVRPVNPPALTDGDEMLYDEPGRCGGQDSHCHHYRVIARRGASLYLLVRHGGGDECIRLSNSKGLIAPLAALDSNGRYWLLNALYHATADARRTAREAEASKWQRAAVEKRIKVRRQRGRVYVEIVNQELREVSNA